MDLDSQPYFKENFGDCTNGDENFSNFLAAAYLGLPFLVAKKLKAKKAREEAEKAAQEASLAAEKISSAQSAAEIESAKYAASIAADKVRRTSAEADRLEAEAAAAETEAKAVEDAASLKKQQEDIADVSKKQQLDIQAKSDAESVTQAENNKKILIYGGAALAVVAYLLAKK